MKKNFAMRVAACLLVVTMLSLCMVSYTYAKFTTKGNDSNVARVAKWGVTVTAELEDLFEKGYVDGPLAELTDNTATVKAFGEYNILAPGTADHTAAALKVEGKPEVAVEIDYTLEIGLNNWYIDDLKVDLDPTDNTVYCPLVITIDSSVRGATDSKVFKLADYTNNIEAFVQAMQDYVDNTFDIEASNGERVNPNTDLSTTINISWSWEFNGDDANDTALGNNAANGYAATFSIALGAVVTQIN